MVPVDELIESPAGMPVADQVKDWPDWLSVAEFVNVAMVAPAAPDWFDLDVTVTVLVMVHENEVDPA